MTAPNSIDKIVEIYFACVTNEEFTYKGKIYTPQALQVSPLIFRDYTCPPACGGCCTKFTLDYIKSEKRPKGENKPLPRKIVFNDKEVAIYSIMQEENDSKRCCNLIMENGRCGIHGVHPFSCDFELIRFLMFSEESHPNVITQKLYGRGWNMLKVDETRGALCEMLPVNKTSINDVERKIKRLQEWCEYFGIKNKCEGILKWIDEVRPFILKNYKIEPLIIK